MFSKYVIDPRPFTLFNPLNAELYRICHLLALLEAHHIFRVSRIRVKTVPFILYNSSFMFGQELLVVLY